MQHAGDAAAGSAAKAEGKAKGDKGDPVPRGEGVAVRNAALAGEDTLVAEVAGRRCAATVGLGGQQGGAGPGSGELDLWLDGEHFHFTWVVEEGAGRERLGHLGGWAEDKAPDEGQPNVQGFYLPITAYQCCCETGKV